MLGKVIEVLVHLVRDGNSLSHWPPASMEGIAVKTITALAVADSGAFRELVAAMPPPLQLRLRSALARAA